MFHNWQTLRAVRIAALRLHGRAYRWTILSLRPYLLPRPLSVHPTLSAWLVRLGRPLPSPQGGHITLSVFVLHDTHGFTLACPYEGRGSVNVFHQRGWSVLPAAVPLHTRKVG